jgi:hypothetical protein
VSDCEHTNLGLEILEEHHKWEPPQQHCLAEREVVAPAGKCVSVPDDAPKEHFQSLHEIDAQSRPDALVPPGRKLEFSLRLRHKN